MDRPEDRVQQPSAEGKHWVKDAPKVRSHVWRTTNGEKLHLWCVMGGRLVEKSVCGFAHVEHIAPQTQPLVLCEYCEDHLKV